jgi:hypothetical protein
VGVKAVLRIAYSNQQTIQWFQQHNEFSLANKTFSFNKA